MKSITIEETSVVTQVIPFQIVLMKAVAVWGFEL